MTQVNTSYKHQTIIALLIGIWVFVFMFVIQPYQEDKMTSYHWFLISLGFGVLNFIIYLTVIVIQNKIYDKYKTWNLSLEVGFIILFYSILLLVGYIFYRSDISQGSMSIIDFFLKDMLPTILILTPLIVIARRFIIKFIPIKSDILTIKGDSKLDLLKIKKDDLVCISTSQNYVEVFYIKDGELVNKLIRTTLKNIQLNIPDLVKSHRSHLFNPQHFIDWENSNTLSLTQKSIPVSKSYKNDLINILG